MVWAQGCSLPVEEHFIGNVRYFSKYLSNKYRTRASFIETIVPICPFLYFRYRILGFKVIRFYIFGVEKVRDLVKEFGFN